MTRAIMIQGTGSSVGKSLIVAGLCRAFKNRGLTVRPFKPQNMSNNAAVTEDGGEIGRAQALQARACGVKPHTDMNPVLLKPETETGAQVVVQGQRLTTVRAREYAALKQSLMGPALESFQRMRKQADLVIIEGAGSPAEINLRANDIANMGFAAAANVPVVLVGDIDRGGVIAQLVGSHAVLPECDRSMIKAFLVNKFRGDVSLFDDGLIEIVRRTGWHNLGVLPWFKAAGKFPAEDAMDIAGDDSQSAIKIAVPVLSRIGNFDDLDPLKADPSVTVELVRAGQAIPGDATLVLIPGSKSTISDLKDFREQGWDIDLLAHVRRGGHVLGLCGGYQMLGKEIVDPEGIEGPAGRTEGLGLLDVTTIMKPHKNLKEVTGVDPVSGTDVNGYEIHIGVTTGEDRKRPFLTVEGQPEGACSSNGRIKGSYLHGVFSSDSFRQAYLASLGAVNGGVLYEEEVETALQDLASHLEEHCNLDLLWRLAEEQD